MSADAELMSLPVYCNRLHSQPRNHVIIIWSRSTPVGWARKRMHSYQLVVALILVPLLQCVHLTYVSAFVAPTSYSFPPRKRSAITPTSLLHESSTNEYSHCSMHTNKLTTASGKPVCRYALGGAARSVQPASLPLKYRDILSNLDDQDDAAPFYFYYNPHRYPAFLSGVAESYNGNNNNKNKYDRKDVFLASGGTELSPAALDQRLNDALVHSGGEYLDAFMLEYMCPYELLLEGDNQQQQLGEELMGAIEHVHKMKKEGKVRYVMASTHSHVVGKALALATLLSDDGTTAPAFDGLMLRYSMSHKNAAESLSLPAALERNIPVLAFTTTRWNRHQTNPPTTTSGDSQLPSSADCIKFALEHPSVEVVLHSARDEEELEESLLPILSASSNGQSTWLSKKERDCWRTYGSDEKLWNEDDSFDEYPEESF